MRFRKLRIAFSALCAIACMLLIVLWVRSQEQSDHVRGHLYGTQHFEVNSQYGILTFSKYNVRHVSLAMRQPNKWSCSSIPIEEWSEKNPLSLQRDGRQFGYFRFANGLGISRPIPKLLGIRADYNGRGSVVYMPYWLLAVLSGALAATPWTNRIKWPNRFSLRTLLIATTLVAVVLGLIACMRR